jgi:aryl-alcohol dehydrogenase-like predicted oxidoreductase
MKYRLLGKSGLRVPEASLGCGYRKLRPSRNAELPSIHEILLLPR